MSGSKTALEEERLLRDVELAPEELTMIAGFRFLSLKPLLLLLNVGEEQRGKRAACRYNRACEVEKLERDRYVGQSRDGDSAA